MFAMFVVISCSMSALSTISLGNPAPARDAACRAGQQNKSPRRSRTRSDPTRCDKPESGASLALTNLHPCPSDQTMRCVALHGVCVGVTSSKSSVCSLSFARASLLLPCSPTNLLHACTSASMAICDPLFPDPDAQILREQSQRTFLRTSGSIVRNARRCDSSVSV